MHVFFCFFFILLLFARTKPLKQNVPTVGGHRAAPAVVVVVVVSDTVPPPRSVNDKRVRRRFPRSHNVRGFQIAVVVAVSVGKSLPRGSCSTSTGADDMYTTYIYITHNPVFIIRSADIYTRSPRARPTRSLASSSRPFIYISPRVRIVITDTRVCVRVDFVFVFRIIRIYTRLS